MMKRYWVHRARRCSLTLAGLVLCAAVAAPAHAQVVQVTRSDAKHSVGFNLGYFMVKGVDSRIDDDVLLADLNDLLFDVDDFNNVTFGGEWLYALSDYVETGVGIGYYQRTVPSIYDRLVNTDGSEIAQDLKLRIVPITATVRFLPLGRNAPVEPYIGGGVGFFNWKYSEVGEFVDFSDNSIFPARYRADGTAVGPVIVAGLRFPIGDAFTTGFEYRWQKAEGNTNAVESGLLTDKIDLGGQSFNWTFHFRF